MTDARTDWESYLAEELARARSRVTALGYDLDQEQVHTKGERYLQSGRKLVLTGVRTQDGQRVIVKVSSHPEGIRELAREHERRRILSDLPFAYLPFHSPEELAFVQEGGLTISVTEFINESESFLKRPLEDQFFLVLKALKEQEGVHATTAAHARTVERAFGMLGGSDYLASFDAFAARVSTTGSEHARAPEVMARAETFLREHADVLDGYTNFLTHTDFVPHNFRIGDGALYLLDHTSLTFGNKYEGWARLANYMALYHPELEQALAEYVRLNRSSLEALAFRLMRVYKLGYLLAHYADNLSKTSGDLQALSGVRLRFWSQVMEAVLEDVPLPPAVVEEYRTERDYLRSEDEKERQRVLGQL